MFPLRLYLPTDRVCPVGGATAMRRAGVIQGRYLRELCLPDGAVGEGDRPGPRAAAVTALVVLVPLAATSGPKSSRPSLFSPAGSRLPPTSGIHFKKCMRRHFSLH